MNSIKPTDAINLPTYGTDGFGLATTARLRHYKAHRDSFDSSNLASDGFNYNVGGVNTFPMFPNSPTSTNGLPNGSFWRNRGLLKAVPRTASMRLR